MSQITVVEAVDLLKDFIHENGIEVLTVAESRGSKDTDIYGQTFHVIKKSISKPDKILSIRLIMT